MVGTGNLDDNFFLGMGASLASSGVGPFWISAPFLDQTTTLSPIIHFSFYRIPIIFDLILDCLTSWCLKSLPTPAETSVKNILRQRKNYRAKIHSHVPKNNNPKSSSKNRQSCTDVESNSPIPTHYIFSNILHSQLLMVAPIMQPKILAR